MEDFLEGDVPPQGGEKRSSNRWWLVVGLLGALASNGYLFWRLERQRADFDDKIAAVHEQAQSELAKLNQSLAAGARTQRQAQESLEAMVATARLQAASAAGKAKTEAVRRAEELAKLLAAEQEQRQRQVAGELSEVKQSATDAHAKVADVSSSVTGVKAELERAVADLRSVTGDLGVQSGLVATNARELAALKALGERDYFEFDLRKTSPPQMVGDVRLALQKTDPKRNKYTLSLVADDRKVEKKDRTTNEPVQFYTLKARLPYEIVVQEVHKDRIVGYLARPKSLELARR